MLGERNLAALLQNMRPELRDDVFVFCSVPFEDEVPDSLHPLLTFYEREGTTLVVMREEAESAGLPYQFVSRLISLAVHSSLEAVGLLAALAGRLAEAGISVNAVSAYYHDHLFVPEDRADEALRLLQEMSKPGS